MENIATSIAKYIFEGFAVALAAYYIPNKKTDWDDILMISLTAATVFLVLDVLAPEIGKSAREGTGFQIGMNQVGGGKLMEGMCNVGAGANHASNATKCQKARDSGNLEIVPPGIPKKLPKWDCLGQSGGATGYPEESIANSGNSDCGYNCPKKEGRTKCGCDLFGCACPQADSGYGPACSGFCNVNMV